MGGLGYEPRNNKQMNLPVSPSWPLETLGVGKAVRGGGWGLCVLVCWFLVGQPFNLGNMKVGFDPDKVIRVQNSLVNSSPKSHGQKMPKQMFAAANLPYDFYFGYPTISPVPG